MKKIPKLNIIFGIIFFGISIFYLLSLPIKLGALPSVVKYKAETKEYNLNEKDSKEIIDLANFTMKLQKENADLLASNFCIFGLLGIIFSVIGIKQFMDHRMTSNNSIQRTSYGRR